MVTKEKLLQWKVQLDKKEQIYNKDKAVLEHMITELKEKYNCKNVEELNTVLKQTEKHLQKLETSLNTACDELEEKLQEIEMAELDEDDEIE